MRTVQVKPAVMRRAGFAVILAILAGSIVILAASASSAGVRPVSRSIPDSYIVTLANTSRAEVPVAARDLARQYGGQLGFVYQDAVKGFSVKMNGQQAEALSRNPRVAVVEQDGEVRAVATQSSPPMGLDRIDQRNLSLDGSYGYLATGHGVTAYVLDTGITPSHTDFGGRARTGFDAIGDGRDGVDCNGHGTHVAGTLGGGVYGVAKAVSLVGVRVLDCRGSGSWSGVTAGVDWVTRNRTGPAVANMSLSGGASATVDQAVANSISSGVHYAVAAGNGDSSGVAQDSCYVSPARVPSAMTVSATDSADRKATWANIGPCVDVFAPGVGIRSAWYSSDTATSTMSGTSMASPHVAGVAASYLQGDPQAGPQAVSSFVTQNSTPDKVQGAGTGSPNKLLYSASIADPGNTPPVVRFSVSCSALTCDFKDASYDPDGAISSRTWDFGDSTSATGASATHAYAEAGTYNATLTVTDNGAQAADGSQSQLVKVSAIVDPDPATRTLTSGETISGVSGAKNSWQYFKILVPGGKSQLATELTGAERNLDLYVRRGVKPTATKYSCRSRSSSSFDSCSVSSPAADWWYIGVKVSSGSNLAYSLRSAFTP